MSNAVLTNNATKLAISTPPELDFDAIVSKNALRSVKGVTRERLLINHSKLFATCAAETRSLLGQEKGNNLPAEIADKLSNAVDAFINQHIQRINPSNAISFRRSFAHKSRDMQIVDKLTAIGENVLNLKEQHLGCNILLTEKNRSLDELMKKPNPDYDREMSVKEEIAKLERTKTFIESCLAKNAEIKSA